MSVLWFKIIVKISFTLTTKTKTQNVLCVECSFRKHFSLVAFEKQDCRSTDKRRSSVRQNNQQISFLVRLTCGNDWRFSQGSINCTRCRGSSLLDLAVMERNQRAGKRQCKISWPPKILCWGFCIKIPRLIILSTQDRSPFCQLFSFALWKISVNRVVFGIKLCSAHFPAAFPDIRYISPFRSSAVSCCLQIFSKTSRVQQDEAPLS